MGAVHGTNALRLTRRLRPLGFLLLAACASSPPATPPPDRVSDPLPPALPDTTGWGVQVLALARSADGGLWAGTAGQGIFVLRAGARDWEQIAARADDSTAIAWNAVNSLAVVDSTEVWYGTVGNGFGRSTDRGSTWRNWRLAQLGPEWQYVAPDGIATAGDTVYIATADGLRITSDGGTTWRCVQGPAAGTGTAPPRDGCTQRLNVLPTDYLLSLAVRNGRAWVGHLHGVSVSDDGGATWRNLGDADGIPRERFRAVAVNGDSTVWAATESSVYVDSTGEGRFVRFDVSLPGWPGLPGAPRALVPSPGALPPSIATSYGLAVGDGGNRFRLYYLAAGDAYRPAADMWGMVWWGPPLWPIGASSAGLNRILAGEGRIAGQTRAPTAAAAPVEPRHTWFRRPIAEGEGNPYIDAAYRYGSTMGGNAEQHQGVEFNNPAGTPVHAVGEGVVVFAGAAEQGSNTVAILHDRRWENQYVFSTYSHNSALDVVVGQRVAAGDVIARVGNTGRATHDHVHLEIHVAPTADSAAIVNPVERFPPHTVNPQLWLEPLPGTGIVAGRVTDGNGQPIQGARIYGLVLAYPEETPFTFVETYGDRAHADPAYSENFAIGDVPAGEYRLAVMIDGARVWRRINVEAGKVTFVEFHP
jgi:murein DD-endopeptidase MepM/ murein hydrolase activator NlpD